MWRLKNFGAMKMMFKVRTQEAVFECEEGSINCSVWSRHVSTRMDKVDEVDVMEMKCLRSRCAVTKVDRCGMRQ